MIRSRVTLATIEAAAIDRLNESPLTIVRTAQDAKASLRRLTWPQVARLHPALWLLAQGGQIDTSAKLARYLPYVRHGSQITVRELLDQISGLQDYLVNKPLLASIEVKRRGDVRRAKLYYLRERSGKSARIREKLGA